LKLTKKSDRKPAERHDPVVQERLERAQLKAFIASGLMEVLPPLSIP
jgi:hypothetical protein